MRRTSYVVVVRRLRAGVRPAPGRRGDDRRAVGAASTTAATWRRRCSRSVMAGALRAAGRAAGRAASTASVPARRPCREVAGGSDERRDRAPQRSVDSPRGWTRSACRSTACAPTAAQVQAAATCSSPIRASAPTAARFIAAGDRRAAPRRCCGKRAASTGTARWHVPNLRGRRTCARASARSPRTGLRRPSRALWMVGVTGTNGKTSVHASGSRRRSTALGRRAAVIGTLGNGFPGALTPSAQHHARRRRAAARARATCRSAARGAWRWKCRRIGLDQGRVNGVRVRRRACSPT
ncbi:MAG: hypothetical protein MZW92_01355 [Comamonadaceae bacterium]|nr:hypothetical protein [Comamonadaceae bacterium]